MFNTNEGCDFTTFFHLYFDQIHQPSLAYSVEKQVEKICKITVLICVEYVFTMKKSIFYECL